MGQASATPTTSSFTSSFCIACEMGTDQKPLLSAALLLSVLGTFACSGGDSSSTSPPTPCVVSAQCSGGQLCNSGICGGTPDQSPGPWMYQSDTLYCWADIHPDWYANWFQSMVIRGNPTVTYLPSGPVVTIAEFPTYGTPSVAQRHELSSHIAIIRPGTFELKTVAGFVTGARTTSKGTFAIRWVPEPVGSPGTLELINVDDPDNPKVAIPVDPSVCNVEDHTVSYNIYVAADTQLAAVSADVLDDDGSVALIGAAFGEGSAVGRCTVAYLAKKTDSGWQVDPIKAASTTELIQAYLASDGTPKAIGDETTCQLSELGSGQPAVLAGDYSFIRAFGVYQGSRQATAVDRQKSNWHLVDFAAGLDVDYGTRIQEDAPSCPYADMLWPTAFPIPTKAGVLLPIHHLAKGSTCATYEFLGPSTDGAPNPVLNYAHCDDFGYSPHLGTTWVSFTGYDITHVELDQDADTNLPCFHLRFVEDRLPSATQ